MAANKILALDIGSTNIKAIVGEIAKDGKLTILDVFRLPSRGIRKGLVSDQMELTSAVNQAFVEIRRNHPDVQKNIFLNIGNAHARVQPSRGIVAVSRADYQIYRDDIQRVIQASQAVNLPPNRQIIHLINQEFVVDNIGDIKDPLGMVGSRLEVNSLIIDAFEPALKSLVKAVETAGGQINGLIFGPLASSQSILTRNQKDLGVALVDIGFGVTGLAVFEEGKLLDVAVFPVGASNVTNDLAVGLKISLEAAEVIKCSFGSALAREVPARETLDLRKIDPRARGTATRRFVAEAGASASIQILEVDVVNSPLTGSFDVAIMRNFPHVLDPASARRVFKNVGQAIKPGGIVYILAGVLDDSRLSPPELVCRNLRMIGVFDEGQFYTEREYRDWLAEAGFQGFERAILPDKTSIVTARKSAERSR